MGRVATVAEERGGRSAYRSAWWEKNDKFGGAAMFGSLSYSLRSIPKN